MSAPPTRILCAFDSFKESISAQDAGNAVIDALHENTSTNVHCINLPFSDGGEGFIASLAAAGALQRQETHCVTGPFPGETVNAPIGITMDGCAVLELATVCGLELVPKDRRDPLNTTTRGLGELLLVAVQEYGCTHVLMGIGGSATNDAGLGALHALGMEVFLDGKLLGQSAAVCGRDLKRVTEIRVPMNGLLSKEFRLEVACDVNSPFVGPKGAVYVR